MANITKASADFPALAFNFEQLYKSFTKVNTY